MSAPLEPATPNRETVVATTLALRPPHWLVVWGRFLSIVVPIAIWFLPLRWRA